MSGTDTVKSSRPSCMYTSFLDYTAGPDGRTAAPRIDTLLAQGSGRVNEDAQLVAEGLYGVFDGATSLVGSTYEGVTGGLLAATTAVEIFEQNDGPLAELAAAANGAIRRKMEAVGVDLGRKEELWSTSLAVVRCREGRLEWCQTGDCRIQLIHEDGSSTQLAEPPDHDAETLQLWQQIAPVSREPIHVALADQILAVRRRMNIDYGVLNGEPEALDFLRCGSVSLAGVSAILLYTDGLHVPDPATGHSHNPRLLSSLFADGGLKAVHSHIRALQEHDPHCRRYPRFKTSDDISAIALYPQQ